MSTTEKIDAFDPNGPGAGDGGLYGLPFDTEEAALVVVPVPWEVTVSYGAGTAGGPDAMLEASRQVDLYDEDIPHAWQLGIAMDAIPAALRDRSDALRNDAETVIRALEEGRDAESEAPLREALQRVNAGCADMVAAVKETCGKWLDQGVMVALLGGDHSTPLGFLQALAERHESFGILQIDAHADLRQAYEGFQYSHASIMYNALQIGAVESMVQVGIRDFCEEEARLAQRDNRVELYSYRRLARHRMTGQSWSAICEEMVALLPDKVYISFDIDGLDPRFCPNTGTPVPGGLDFDEALFLIEAVVNSGRQIIGLDLVEVAPGDDEWDANVGARLLYRMCNLMARSQEKL